MSTSLITNRSSSKVPRYAALGSTLVLSCMLTACKARPAVDDASLNRSVQNQLGADTALSGQSVQSNVQNGVVVLNGTVSNDAQRTLAARDVAGIAGVKEVINQLSVATTGLAAPSQTATVAVPTPAPVPVPVKPITTLVQPTSTTAAQDRAARADRLRQQREDAQRNQQARNAQQQNQQNNGYNQQAGNYQLNNAAPIERVAPVVAPPVPQFRTVTVTSGSTVSVRITQNLDSATTQAGDSFSGVLSSDVLVDGVVALPAGSAVNGQVDEVHEAGHFKGASLLTVSLSGITRRGDRIAVSSEPYTVQGKGRGTNTAEKVGGGAAVGAILGGIFGGGKGAAIGAGAGGGLGAGAQAVTRGQQVQIPSESIVRFHLTTPVTVKVRTDNASAQQNDLQRRNNNN